MGIQIEYAALQDLRPYENNARTHPDIGPVKESIRSFGFNVPILVDENGVIVAGHARYQAAKELGLESVPVIVLQGLSETDLAQLRLVENKTSELSSWDYSKLIFELGSITEMDMSAFSFGDVIPGVSEPKADTNLDEGVEIDLSDYSDEAFELECPYCGFMWNE